MYVSRITLSNVRQFENRTFEFQPGFNLLVGENGAGKTTILRALLATLGSKQQTGHRPGLASDDISLRAERAQISVQLKMLDLWSREFSYSINISGPVRQSPRHKGSPLVLFYASNEAACAGMKFRRHGTRLSKLRDGGLLWNEEFLYRSEIEFEIRSGRQSGRRFGNSQSVRSFVNSVLTTFSSDFDYFYWRFEPYECLLVPPRGLEVEQFPDLFENVQSFAMRFFQQEWKRKELIQWPDRSKIILGPERSELGVGERHILNLQEIWDGMRIAPEARKFLQTCSLEVKLAPRIIVQRDHGTLNLSQLSDGEQRLFSLFVDIARRLSLQNPHADIGLGEAIVLIDEIDVHLHPKWQRRIVPALEKLFPHCQFIVTTHSPFIVQATSAGGVQHIDGKPIGDLADRGIEEIAVKVMDVNGETGIRYIEMLKAAKEYLRALGNAQVSNSHEVAELRGKLLDLSGRYARNPAYQAFLELKTDARLGSED